VDALHRAAYLVSRTGALAGGLLILAAAILIALDITLRATVVRSIGGADELSGYALAIMTAWGMSFALLERAHIRIDSLYEHFPRYIRALADLVSVVAFLFYISLTTWYAWGVASQSIQSSARSISALAIPVAVPQLVWLSGFIFLLLVLLLLLIEASSALVRGDFDKASRLIGSKAVSEEVTEEREEQEALSAARRG
jgi:TRAP-type C4-dicarboxylate transport system permease small subunit